MTDIADRWRRARVAHDQDPAMRRMSAIFGIGYLMGAGQIHAAEAVTKLFVEHYGKDALPDHIKELEGDSE